MAQKDHAFDYSQLKSKARITLLAVIAFVAVYLLIIGIVVGLTFMCAWLFYTTLIKAPNLIFIGFCGFLLVFLGTVSWFLLRFMIQKHPFDTSGLIEITARDEPKLFAAITAITQQLNTEFPAHVYLAQSVSASVTFDSSLKGLLFKSPRNLQIGAGLINTLHEEELKAVIAHEFGHFSQKELRTGSYVYYLNQVIYSFLYDEKMNTSIGKMQTSVPVFNLVASLAAWAIHGTRWILAQMYRLVNKSYMALSREMEFHADACAAKCTVPQALGNALMRLELSEGCFNEIIGFYNTNYAQHITTKNLYPQHLWLMQLRGKEYNLPFRNDLPEVNLSAIRYFDRSQLIIEDQWASHPLTPERVKRLQQLPGATDYPFVPAWNLFVNPADIQEKVTAPVFTSNDTGLPETSLGPEDFRKRFSVEYERLHFDLAYRFVYNERDMDRFDLTAVSDTKDTLATIFTDELCDHYYSYIALQKDIQLLEHIASRKIKISTFDYNGRKYKRKEAAALITALSEKMEQHAVALRQADQRSFHYFAAIDRRSSSSGTLSELYSAYFSMRERSKADHAYFESFVTHTAFLSRQLEYETIRHFCALLLKQEHEFRKRLAYHFHELNGKEDIPQPIREKVSEYLKQHQAYFFNGTYIPAALEKLDAAMNAFPFLTERSLYRTKKALLDYQMKLERDASGETTALLSSQTPSLPN
jgi:Zn-dependent protease with chaperone function